MDSALTKFPDQVIVTPRNKSDNILEPHYARAVEELNTWITHSIYAFDKGARIRYNRLCYEGISLECWMNQFLTYVNENYEYAPEELTYPSTQILDGFKLYYASALGGVQLRKVNGQVTNYIYSARSWLLTFHLYDSELVDRVSAKWEHEFELAIKNLNHPDFDVYYFHSKSLENEFRDLVKSLIKDFAKAFLILIAFTTFVGLHFVEVKRSSSDGRVRRAILIDWTKTKSTLCALSCVNAGMGVVTAIGILVACQMYWIQFTVVMPFLVVAIGVDNAFLLMAAWERTSARDSIEYRMSYTLSESAVSITITSLTDFLSFSVACITTIPGVKAFCLYTAFAIAATFVYQLTFFAALMVLAFRQEASDRNHCFLTHVTPFDKIDSVSCTEKFLNVGSVVLDEETPSLERFPVEAKNTMEKSQLSFTTFFRRWYGPLITHPVMKLIVISWYIIYIALAAYGCTFIKEGVDQKNLVAEDSQTIHFYDHLVNDFFAYGQQVQIVVSTPPDFNTNALKAVNETLAIAEKFTNTHYTMGQEGVLLWVDDYMRHLQEVYALPILDTDPGYFTRYLRDGFLNVVPFSRWKADIAWADGPEQIIDIHATQDSDTFLEYPTLPLVPDGSRYEIKAFRFLIGMRNFKTIEDQINACALVRTIAAEHPQYNITTMWPFWALIDNFSLVIPGSIQNFTIALICMFIVSLLLIPHILCAVFVTLSIVSIAFGIIGFMSLWGVRYDFIALVTMIMSIGFSVDFSAHITHGYVTAGKGLTSDQRVCHAVARLGTPIVLGAVSTLLGVAVLGSIKVYMVQTFFKIVVLVITIGLTHSLVFLPVTLSLLVGERFVVDGTNQHVRSDRNEPIMGSNSTNHNNGISIIGEYGDRTIAGKSKVTNGRLTSEITNGHAKIMQNGTTKIDDNTVLAY